ncbi:porin [Aureibacter tunicatorum]|uniref:Porin n=1 Tax=Aureibacter tunicatorum TaxID=866807 RepID=A0AAE4BT52_9BACT|nr:porin [Aureibacter tunicatorum]MDR6240431.1 hypothetical protein [Aureibacter tunicatorum]BDD05690.1 porin [Aureibacter tunicatorum]
MKRSLLLIICLLCLLSFTEQSSAAGQEKPEEEKKFSLFKKNNSQEEETEEDYEKKPWYQKIGLSGYAQIRYNGLFQTNPDLRNEQGDKGINGSPSFSFRRIRLKVAGFVHPRVYVYIQPDFASGGDNSAQIRDAYFDYYLNKEKTFRIRGGQSKVPFGFENLQSSQNRIALDRNDAINSAFSNERDLMMSFYWTPKIVQERYKFLNDNNLKFSGDYGMFGFGILNGQTANKPDENGGKHIVARFSYPFQFKNGQIIELGVQAYTGQYVTTNVSDSVYVKQSNPEAPKVLAKGANFLDQRMAFSFIMFPQPFGLQAEYTFGQGPEYDPETNTIGVENLHGGYVQAMYKADLGKHSFIPFVKYQYYDGGKKHEFDARSYTVNDLEIGFEWHPNRAFELTAEYMISNRRYEDSEFPINHQIGNLLRIQAQINF